MYLNLYIVILCKKYATLHKVNHQISLLEGLANKANHNFTMHSVPGSLYSFRFRFSRISVFYNKKFKKNRETAEFIPDQLRFHGKNFS